MRERLREFVAASFYYSGLINLVLRWQARSKKQLIVLNYHRAEGNLEAQMRYLSRHYRILHLEQALEELYATQPVAQSGKKKHDSRIPLVLTFDDGYLDNYTQALPLAQKFQVPITIFIIPGYVESGQYFWWMATKYLLKQVKGSKVKFDGEIYQLVDPIEKQKLIKVIDKHLRYASTIIERETFLSKLQQELDVTLPTRRMGGDDEDVLPMTWEQIHEMEATGLVSFGAHTMNHPVLSALSDKDELLYEVGESRVLLEQNLGHPVRTFAYPIGKPQHYGDQGVQAVKSSGFSWAVTTIEDVNTEQTDPFLVRRLPGDETLHWMVMAAELTGLLGIMSRFRKKYAELFKK
jgi:peptidoglycan/xylan/chitin deacetylase (PgdA/CDA1 family)